MAQSTMPTISAPTKDSADNHTVVMRPCPNSGRYSTMVRKLKFSSIVGEIPRPGERQTKRIPSGFAALKTRAKPLGFYRCLVILLPGVGIDPVVEVFLQAAVDGDLVEEQVHPDQQIRLVIAGGEGKRLLRQKIRHDGEAAGGIGRRLALDRRD